MRFIPTGQEQKKRMLESVGVEDADGLFASIPEQVRYQDLSDLPDAMSEAELSARLSTIASECSPATEMISFLGAGCYDHHLPAIVDHVVRKPEFFTAYTPYQPEVSQGTLQAIYEFQSLICRLTGMEVANASMYDGASAMAEAALLAVHATRRNKVLIADTVHPEWRQVVETYLGAQGDLVVEEFASEGGVDIGAVQGAAADAACIVIADPDFLGCIGQPGELATAAHAVGALLVVATDPMLLGVLEEPGAYGADVVVGEGQSLGSAMSFGGPGLGFFACKEKYLRRMPGRIAGRTLDSEGTPGFVLTMQTREQHIRREKATSNICSNHALNALATCVHLLALGSDGLARTGYASVAKAHYLHDALLGTGRFTEVCDAPFGREFVLRFDGDVGPMQEAMLEQGYLAGLDLGRFGREGEVLFAVTERRTRQDIDGLVEAVARI